MTFPRQDDRNLLILLESMRGVSLRALALEYHFSAERARQIVLTEFYRRWPQIYLQYPTGRTVRNGGVAPFPSAKIPKLREAFKANNLHIEEGDHDQQ